MGFTDAIQGAVNHATGSLGYVAVAAVLALVIYGFHPIKRWQYRRIPGPSPTWMVGNLVQMMSMGLPEAMQAFARQYGPVFKVWQGGTVLIIVEDPEGVRAVNMRNHERPPILSTMAGKEKEFDQASILISGGKLWQSLRQAWQTLFHPNNLRAYTTVMNASADRLVNILGKKAKAGEPVEVWRLFGCLTMEVICSTALGMDMHALQGDGKAIGAEHATVQFDDADDDAMQLQKAAAVLFGFSGARASPYVALRLLFPDLVPLIARVAMRFPDHNLAKVMQARTVMRRLCVRLIEKTRQQMQALGISTMDGEANGRRPSSSLVTAVTNGGNHADEDLSKLLQKTVPQPDSIFITRLLEANNKLLGRPFTDMEVASQINTFLLAGYETTASALAFTVYHVACNPDKEAKLLAEIDAFGRSRAPTLEDLDQLPYLEAVFNEALRLSPPAAFGTIRVARENMTVCGYELRKGWYLNTAQLSTHHNPKYWEDSEAFVPERFLDAKTASSPAFSPFGDGGRSCVGLRFAKAEAKIALIRLYQHHTLRLVPGQVPLKTRTTITMSPKHGITVTVHPRA